MNKASFLTAITKGLSIICLFLLLAANTNSEVYTNTSKATIEQVYSLSQQTDLSNPENSVKLNVVF